MPVDAKFIEETIKNSVDTLFVRAIDISGGCGAKFDVLVVSTIFEGVPLLDRHRKVNESLKDILNQIHAITIKAWTPKQYEERKSSLEP